jgi:hypothetical protein
VRNGGGYRVRGREEYMKAERGGEGDKGREGKSQQE